MAGVEADERAHADKEGGIHDFAWSPNDREFSVTYGCSSPPLSPSRRSS